jgi:hypothetical protein
MKTLSTSTATHPIPFQYIDNTNMNNNNDANIEPDIREDWHNLCSAIIDEDVSAVENLLTLHPQLAYYRTEEVSPLNDTHGFL